MRILCLCHGGRVRSVAVRYYLTDESGLTCCDVLAAGLTKNTTETIDMLAAWADAIIVVSANMVDALPHSWRNKTFTVDLDDDIWGNAEHPGLRAKIRELMRPIVHDLIKMEHLIDV